MKLRNRDFQILTGLLNLPLVFLFYFAVFVVTFPEFHGTRAAFGLPRELFFDGFDYLLFARWLLIITAPLVVCGLFLERSDRIELLFLLRMRTRNDFRRLRVRACFLITFFWVLILSTAACISTDIAKGAALFFILLLQMWLWSVIQIYFYYAFRRAASSIFVVLGLYALLCYLGLRIPMLSRGTPATWGMLYLSRMLSSDGLPYIHMALRSAIWLLLSLFLLHFYKEKG